MDSFSGIEMGHAQTGTQPLNSEESLHYGRHVLWPIPPNRASNALERWKGDHTLRHSRLVEIYKPSRIPFFYKNIAGYTLQTEFVIPSTLKVIQTLFPRKIPLMNQLLQCDARMPEFHQPESSAFGENPVRFTSNVVTDSKGLIPSSRFVQHLTFTASEDVGWNALDKDTQLYVWELIVDECLATSGGACTSSFCTWLSLRAVCLQSHGVLKDRTSKLMTLAMKSIETAIKSSNVCDSICVRDLIVSRGLNVHHLRLESINNVSNQNLIYVYMRLRTGIHPNQQPPPPRLAKMSILPVRSSMRLGARRSMLNVKLNPTKSATFVDHNHARQLQNPEKGSFSKISVKLCITNNSHSACTKRGRTTDTSAHNSNVSSESKRKRKSVQQLVNWVACVACSKWRRLPSCAMVGDIPELWYCTMHPSGCVTCSDAEEVENKSEITTAYFDGAERDVLGTDTTVGQQSLFRSDGAPYCVSTRITRSKRSLSCQKQ